jgi:tetratricopeptide (TPR) repeat protein
MLVGVGGQPTRDQPIRNQQAAATAKQPADEMLEGCFALRPYLNGPVSSPRSCHVGASAYFMKRITFLLACCAALLASPAVAQKTKVKNKGAAAANLPLSARRQLPLFGGLTPEAAQQLVGDKFLRGLEQSFASRAEASQFFARKGYEYLTEGQPDTARYRFNLAWLLDPKNADVYRGLGLLTANSSVDEAMGLFTQSLALAPNNAQVLTDLGGLYTMRYGQTKKAKDLKLADEHLRKALAADPNSTYTWQQLAWVQYYQGDYAQAWESLHKGSSNSLAGVDFELVSNLKEKMPDPKGLYK